MRLCDTDVLVDLVRGYAPALQWFQTLAEPAGVAGIAYMEVIAGCANKLEITRVQALLSPLPVYWPTDLDCQRALADFTQYHLSHNLGLLDSLVAATAIGRGAALCTFNVKHFRVVPGLTTEQPYSRP